MSTATNLLYTDVEDSLRLSVRSILAKRDVETSASDMYEGSTIAAINLWSELSTKLGLNGLLISEDLGGSGASAREAAVVLEELGRFAAPVPFLTSSVVAVTVLKYMGATPLLAELANGDLVASLTVPASAAFHGYPVSVTCDDQGRLSGTVNNVLSAFGAHLLLVPVNSEGGLQLRVVNPQDPGVKINPVTSLDMTRQISDIHFHESSSTAVSGSGDADSAVRAGLHIGAALLCSEQLGVAEWCLDTTVAYLKQRRQFARPIGGFQAIKHRLADLWVEVGSMRTAARYAAATIAENGDDRFVAASLGQAFCSASAVHIAEECVQLHGGVGMTWEHGAHIFLKRAKADQIIYGTPGGHRAHLGTLIDLPLTEARG